VYVGHVGIALALRASRDAPPLWLLALAAQGPDWIDLAWDATGGSWANPAWTAHGFPLLAAGTLLTAIAAAGMARGGRARPARAATIGAAAYASHWAADWFTGHKPTWPGRPLVGLGWYDRPALDLALEAAVVVAGWWLWRRRLPPGPRRDAMAWALLATLLALQLAADVVMAGGVHVL